MDIKSIQPTAKVGYELDLGKGKVESINFVVSFIAIDELGDHLPSPTFDKDGRVTGPGKRPKFSALARAMLIDAVQGWDLTENGTAIPCDEANKQKYLPIVLGLKVSGPAPSNPLDAVLGRALLLFATDPENFLKN